MSSDTSFLVGLLDEPGTPGVNLEDFQGPHGQSLRRWQELGFIGNDPFFHPAPSCPHCGEGTPYRLDGRFVCSACASSIDEGHLCLWTVDTAAFLGWLANRWGLRGGVVCIEENLWHLGSGTLDGDVIDCFFRRRGPLSSIGSRTLAARRSAWVLFGGLAPIEPAHPGHRCVSLLDVLLDGEDLRVVDLASFPHGRREVRFDAESGALWIGSRLLGEVRSGSREFHFLACLAERLDTTVPYSDLKREVLSRSGGRDETDEATFCHKLKNRIKKHFVPEIGEFLVATHRGDGYRLRARGERLV